ncbi:MAG: hypothetical protein AAFZ01_05445 [Pseudomonadota bacterium]
MFSAFQSRMTKRAVAVLIALLVVGTVDDAHAANRVADLVTENFVPTRHNGACIANVAVASDGDITGTAGYCPVPGQPTHEITFTFNNPNIDEFYHGVTVWSNSGTVYTDDELRIFDLEVDYTDPVTNTPQTLIANDVDIGDTLSVNDPKFVSFASLGGPDALPAITAVRIDNLRSSGTTESAFREFQLTSDPPELAVIKSGVIDGGGDGIAHAGDTVNYTYVVTNTTNETVFNVSVTDQAGDFTGAGSVPTPTLSSGGNDYDGGAGTPTDIRPGETVTFTASYALEQADINAGALANQARADGVDFHNEAATDLSGATNADDNPTVTTLPPRPELNLEKLADNDTGRGAGETIVYTYTVTNTGNMPINGVTISDSHNGTGPPPVPAGETLVTDNTPVGDSTDAASDASWDTLAPGDIISFSGSYIVTQTDVDTLQ